MGNVSVTVAEPAANVTVVEPFQVPPLTVTVAWSAATAVPLRAIVTVSAAVVAPERANVHVAADPPSAPLPAVTVTTGVGGGTSLSTIVTTPSPSAIVAAPLALDSVTVNVSSPSKSVSPSTWTAMTAELWPTANVTGPDWATNSAPGDAVPGPVTHWTVVAS